MHAADWCQTLLAAFLARVRGELFDVPDIAGGVRASAGDDGAVDLTVAFGYAAARVAARSSPMR
jgi:hypothetical protein